LRDGGRCSKQPAKQKVDKAKHGISLADDAFASGIRVRMCWRKLSFPGQAVEWSGAVQIISTAR